MSRRSLWHASPPDATKVPLTFTLESSTVTAGLPVAAKDKERACGVGPTTLLPELKRTGSSATIVRRGCVRYRTAVPAALLHVTHEPPCGGIGTDVCQPRLSTGLRLVLSVEPRGRPGRRFGQRGRGLRERADAEGGCSGVIVWTSRPGVVRAARPWLRRSTITASAIASLDLWTCRPARSWMRTSGPSPTRVAVLLPGEIDSPRTGRRVPHPQDGAQRGTAVPAGRLGLRLLQMQTARRYLRSSATRRSRSSSTVPVFARLRALSSSCSSVLFMSSYLATTRCRSARLAA